MPTSLTDSANVVALMEEGNSQRYVAQTLRIPRSTVQRVYQRYRETGGYSRRPGSGRKRATSARDDRFIVSNTLRDRHSTAVDTRRALQEIREVNVSERTVRRRLNEAGLKSRRPNKGPELLQQHRVERLRFALNHVNWNQEEWTRVLFTDESRFCLRSPDGRERVWRRRGERFAPCTFSPRVSFQGGSVMVWGGISYEARTELVFVDGGSLTAARYIEEVLLEHVVPYAPIIGEEFLLMHDNARPHAARIVNEFLNDVGLHAMAWPARSPDINPIEHVWDMLKKRVRSRLPPHSNLHQLRNLLTEEWNNIDQTVIQNLIEGLNRRMAAVIQSRGGNTRY